MERGTSYATLQQNSIKYMLSFVEEYELVRNKRHPDYRYARDFFLAKGICFQNFYKFYRRFIAAGRDGQKLLPQRRGPKPKYRELPTHGDDIVTLTLSYREKGYNRYLISTALQKSLHIKGPCSPSTIYRILRKHGASRLTKPVLEEKRKIVRKKAGSLVHIDCHQLPKGILKSDPLKKFYTLGVIDDYSRIAWVEVIESTKAIDATFAMMDIILALNEVYGIKIDEALTDNGGEFCGGKTTLHLHPFERLLTHFAIKHRRTKPYRPQTNGKIERFWRTFDDEVIEGAEFNNMEELKDAVLGYNFYYNQHRPHQGINGKIPINMLNTKLKNA